MLLASDSLFKGGTENCNGGDDIQDTAKLLTSVKRDERLFIQYERCFEKLQIELIQLTKFSKGDFELKFAVSFFFNF